MSDQPEGLIPLVPFGLSELKAIESLLLGYSQYLQKFPASTKNARRIRSLEQIRVRLAAQLASKNQGIQLFLDLGEVEELLAALFEFATLVKRLFPQNEKRDSVIESVNAWRLRLIHIISEFEGGIS
jgi:hypothetical protein